jgi:thiol-disulfide isomerase/thioredoxin
MSQVQNDGTQTPRKRGAIVWLLVGLIAVAAALYGAIWFAAKSGHGAGLKDLAKGEMSKLVVAEKWTPPPAITAQDADGRTVTLSALKGQVVVVNLWATWCAPCVKEMPTLAKLQGAYAGQEVKVLPISLDKGPEDIAKAKAFIADKAPLKFYHGDYDLAFSLNPPAEGLPTTLIFDRNGRERARLSGGADWSTPEAKAVLDRVLSLKG